MTTQVQEKSQVLSSERDLEHYFHSFAKAANAKKVGIEAEFFGVFKKTGQALPYFGPVGVQEILKRMAKQFGYEPILESENIIGLQRTDASISLEPGGQIELSAPPVHDIFDVQKQVQKFVSELKLIARGMPEIAFLAAGMQPFSMLEEISWVPKTRYAHMAEHFNGRGALSHHMMKRTCTNQVNLDYISEQDAVCMVRTAMGITSIVSAMFANSAFAEGRPNGYKTYRMEIWKHTDPARTGLLPKFFEQGRHFSDYLEYMLDMPFIFIVRSGKWTPLPGLTFRQFLKNGYQGAQATLGDFELHLSTAFPEVRIKQYVEVRGADCQAPDLIPCVAAFWKGILYDGAIREKAWALVADASVEERMKLHEQIPIQGLEAKLGSRPILPIAEKLVDLACASLGQQREMCSPSESIFIETLRDRIIRPGKTPADTVYEKWLGEWKRDSLKLIEYHAI